MQTRSGVAASRRFFRPRRPIHRRLPARKSVSKIHSCRCSAHHRKLVDHFFCLFLGHLRSVDIKRSLIVFESVAGIRCCHRRQRVFGHVGKQHIPQGIARHWIPVSSAVRLRFGRFFRDFFFFFFFFFFEIFRKRKLRFRWFSKNGFRLETEDVAPMHILPFGKGFKFTVDIVINIAKNMIFCSFLKVVL